MEVTTTGQSEQSVQCKYMQFRLQFRWDEFSDGSVQLDPVSSWVDLEWTVRMDDLIRDFRVMSHVDRSSYCKQFYIILKKSYLKFDNWQPQQSSK